MKVTIYDGIWHGCTWFVEVDKLTLNEVISHMQKWFNFQEPIIKENANEVILRGGQAVPHPRKLIHELKFKECRNSNSTRPLIIFEERWKPNYRILRYWELGLLENNRITPLWCDKNGNLQKIDFSYRLTGLLVNYEATNYPYCFAHNKQIYSYLKEK